VVARLNDANKAIQDYLLLPAAERAERYLRLSDTALARHRAVRFENFDELTREIKFQLRARGASGVGSTRQRRRSK
jgi:hypothetical protein